MKHCKTLSAYFYLTCFISLSLFVSCGDTEDTEDTTNATANPLLDESNLIFDAPDEQLLQLKDEDWEKLKDEDWVRLTDEEVEELMNLDIPQRWGAETQDHAVFKKFHHATLFQRFGDIPQVRYIVEVERMARSGIITLGLAKQIAAHAEAMYFLVPNADTQRSLQETRNLLKSIEAEEGLHLLDQLRIEDPEAWVKGMRAVLIKRHGDVPEVKTIIDFMRKLELKLPRTDHDCRAYMDAYRNLYGPSDNSSPYEFYAMLEAVDQTGRFVGDAPLRRLEKYREARAKGISFYDIDWSDA